MKRRVSPAFIGILLVFAIMGIYIFYTFAGLDRFFSNSSGTRVKATEQAIQKAAIQCYALEGSYPPNIEYLEKHYGIVLDKSRYYYYYEVFASNVMPEIGVYEKNNKKGDAVYVQ